MSSESSESTNTDVLQQISLVDKHKQDLETALKCCRDGEKVNIDEAVALFRTGKYEHKEIVEAFNDKCLLSWKVSNSDEVPFT